MSLNRDLDRSIARVLIGGTYLSVGLLAVGVVLMAVDGISPLDAAPPFQLARVPADIASLRSVGFLWLGLLIAIATPLARVAAALVGYVAGGERRMALISIAILLVIAIGVLVGVAFER